jgi:hypothetical protein
MDEEWPIAELFDEDYLHFYGARLADDASDGEASRVWELLALRDGSSVLDLACGHGRIANRLAAMGALVTVKIHETACRAPMGPIYSYACSGQLGSRRYVTGLL